MCNFWRAHLGENKNIGVSAHTHRHTHTCSDACEYVIGLLLCWGCKWATIEQWYLVYRNIHRQRVHNVFMCCHCRQQEKRVTATCVLQSQTLMQQIHLVLSLKRMAKAMKLCLGPMRGYYCLAWTRPPLGVLKWSWVERDRSSHRASRPDSPVINSSA